MVGLVVLIGYTIFAGLQWYTMNKTYTEIAKQTPHIADAANAARDNAKLTRQQVVSTQAAHCIIRINSTSEGVGRIGIENDGKSNATHVEGRVKVTIETIQGGTIIGQPKYFPISIGQIQASRSAPEITIQLPTFSKVNLEAGRTFAVRAAVTYNNGFDDVIAVDFCEQATYLARNWTQLSSRPDYLWSNCGEIMEAVIRMEAQDKQNHK